MILDGEFLTHGTVWLAVSFYYLALVLKLFCAPRSHETPRRVWSLAFLLYVAHVVCAFHFYHDWSHAAAYEATAERTAAVAGLEWGGGLYWNYAFTLLWFVDVIWSWGARRTWIDSPQLTGVQTSRSWIAWAVHAFLFFMVFQATVVFGSSLVRWLGLAAALLLVSATIRARRRRISKGC